MKRSFLVLLTALSILSLLLASCNDITPTAVPTAAPTSAPTAAPTAAPTEAPTEPEPTEEDHDYPTDGSFYLKPGMTVAEAGTDAIEKIIQETALAYYYKNPYMQYEDRWPDARTILGDEGTTPLTPRQSPEETTPETPYYAVCRSLPADIYWDAFGIKTPGFDAHAFSTYAKKGTCVFAYGSDVMNYTTDNTRIFTDKEEFMTTIKADMRPGDIILASREDSGHVLLFLGDCLGDGEDYVIHSWPYKGGKWSANTGLEVWEPEGAARLQRAADVIYDSGPSPNWPLNSERMINIAIFRYLDDADFLATPLTDAAVTRYNKQGLDVTKTSTSDVYDTVLSGEEITIRETIANHSKEAYSVTVREAVPEGTSFVSAASTAEDPGAFSDGSVVWKVTVPAEGSVEVSYTVKVTAAEPGDLRFPAGTVSTLPTRSVLTKIGKNRLTDAEIQTLQDNALATAEEIAAGDFADLGFVNLFYEKLFGVKVGLPENLADFMSPLYDVKRPFLSIESYAIVRKKEPSAEMLSYLIPKCELGFYYHNADYVTNTDRIQHIAADYFMPGDVLVEMHGANFQRYRNQDAMSVNIYLGDGKVLCYSMEDVEVKTFKETVACATKYNYAAILRPMNGAER